MKKNLLHWVNLFPVAVIIYSIAPGMAQDFSAVALPIADGDRMDPKTIQIVTAMILMMVAQLIKGIDRIPDKYIPVILWIGGAVTYCFQTAYTKTNVIDGLLCAGAAIGINQTAKQLSLKTTPITAPVPQPETK